MTSVQHKLGERHSERSELRDRRAHRTVLLACVQQLLRLVLGMIGVPIALAYFGREQYGFWIATTSVVAYVALIQPGLTGSLISAVGGARGRDDQEAVGKIVSGAFFLSLALASTIVVVAVLALQALPSGNLLGVHGSPPDARSVLLVVIMAGAADTVLGIVVAAQRGYQEDYYANAWQVLGAVAAFVSLLLVVLFKGALLHLALCVSASGLLLGIANALRFVSRHAEAVPHVALIDATVLTPLLRQGMLFWAMQICALLVLYTDNLIIAVVRGTSEVVVFGLAMQLTILGLGLIHSLSAAYWGGYAEAAARGDWAWFNAAFERVLLLSMCAAGACAVCLYAWGQDLFLLWIGPEHVVPQDMLLAFALFILANIWYSAHGVVLNSLGRLRQQLFVVGAEGILHVTAAVVLVQCCGATSVAWALFVPAVLVSSWCFPLLVKRTQVRLVGLGLLLRGMVLPAVIAVAVASWLDSILPQAAGIRLTAGTAGTLLCYVSAAMVLLGKERHRFLPWTVRFSASGQRPG